MDNLTHSLTGWALGQTGLKRKTRKGLAALILGANMPDIDVFFGWVPWVPLATHRGFTHGLVGGVLLMPPLLAALLWLLDRWQVRRGAEFRSGLAMHFGWLLALSYLGALSHPLLDWQTAYAIQLFSPFDSRWYHADTLFIIDIWILLGLGSAIALSVRREARGIGTWRRPAIAALALVAAYVSLNGGITVLAKRAIEPWQGRPEVIVANSPPLYFWRRELVWKEHGLVAGGTFDPTRSLRRLQSYTRPYPDGMDDPVVRQAMTASPEVVRFLRWSIVPAARPPIREDCTVTVTFVDARFARAGGFFASATLPLDPAGC